MGQSQFADKVSSKTKEKEKPSTMQTIYMPPQNYNNKWRHNDSPNIKTAFRLVNGKRHCVMTSESDYVDNEKGIKNIAPRLDLPPESNETQQDTITSQENINGLYQSLDNKYWDLSSKIRTTPKKTLQVTPPKNDLPTHGGNYSQLLQKLKPTHPARAMVIVEAFKGQKNN